jgi:putative flavoprotein involved in K+ transport
MQLVGRVTAGEDLDLATLQARGVRLAGRLTSVDGQVAAFAAGLPGHVADADRRMHRFLDAVDRYVDASGLSTEVWAPERPRPVELADVPERLDLRAEGISTVVLAAGYRPHHPWLRLPLTEADGSIRQHRGVTAAPGVYVVGQRFQHRRDSGFIDGARHDAAQVVAHLCSGQRAVSAVREVRS